MRKERRREATYDSRRNQYVDGSLSGERRGREESSLIPDAWEGSSSVDDHSNVGFGDVVRDLRSRRGEGGRESERRLRDGETN